MLQGEDLGVKKGFSVMTLSSCDDQAGFVTPLESIGMDDSKPIYILNKSISQEYIHIRSSVNLSPICMYPHIQENFISLDTDDLIENILADHKGVDKVRANVIDSPPTIVNCNEEMHKVKCFSTINYAKNLN